MFGNGDWQGDGLVFHLLSNPAAGIHCRITYDNVWSAAVLQEELRAESTVELCRNQPHIVALVTQLVDLSPTTLRRRQRDERSYWQEKPHMGGH